MPWLRVETPDNRSSILDGCSKFFSSPQPSHYLWDILIRLSSGRRGLCHRGYSGQSVKLTTHLHLVTRLIILRTITSLLWYVLMAWCLRVYKDTDFSLHFVRINLVTTDVHLKRIKGITLMKSTISPRMCLLQASATQVIFPGWGGGGPRENVLWAQQPGLYSQQCKFSFSTASRPVLGTTQPPLQ
jgi:hypothetical protein